MNHQRNKVGIVCCSNGLRKSYEGKLHELEEALRVMGVSMLQSAYIYEEDTYVSASAEKRANALMEFYENEEITDIFDISGGDLANGILPYLDYRVMEQHKKCFWGYSDLTTVLNAIFTKTGQASGLYQIRNLLSEHREQQMADVKDLFADPNRPLETMSLFKLQYHFVQGHHMSGILIGGNIRCFLKLAGTEYMPDFQNKILLLESRSGLIPQMETFLSQLQQMGAFDKVKGILLGTFTQLEKEEKKDTIVKIVQKYAGNELPIAITKEIGHGTDSKAVMVGAYYEFCEICGMRIRCVAQNYPEPQKGLPAATNGA